MANNLFKINLNAVDSQNIQNINFSSGSAAQLHIFNITSKTQTFTITNNIIQGGIIFSIENPNYITQSIISIIIPYIESSKSLNFKILNSTIDASVTIYTSGSQLMYHSAGGGFLPPYGSTTITNNNHSIIEFIYVKPYIHLIIS